MRKTVLNICLVAVLMSASVGVAAQGVGAVGKVNVPYIVPKSGVKVTLNVACEQIKKGPYAKFAQQLLGVNAPLNDKTTYEIVSASLSGFTEGDVSSIYTISDAKAAPLEVVGLEVEYDNAPKASVPTTKDGVNNPVFSDLSITPIVYQSSTSLSSDRTSTREKSVEEMASDAANTIFTLRKRRFDLVTGESSEGAFGAGLSAAIEEMKRIEDEYLSLFVGKKSVVVKEFQFDVVPTVGQSNYVVCRYTKDGGVIDATDVSGEPILLVVNPEGTVRPSVDKKSTTAVRGAITYRVADMANCKLLNSQTLIDSKRLPILQYGATIEVLPSR